MKLIYTIGHSTLPIEEFILRLTNFHIKALVDVRTIPKSRFNPQFNTETLAKSLAKKDILYQHMPGLGGLRKSKKDSINMGWRNTSFRGYADYMQTDEFEENLQALIKEAKKHKTAIMCAEAVPWRCHRSLIADRLLVAGFEVHDIMSADKDALHKINPMAKVSGQHVTYPGDPQLF
jgi:uncharacterized protein (DUF488 family)